MEPSYKVIPVTDQLFVPLAIPLPPRLFDQVTWVTPTMSSATPLSDNGLLDVVYVLFDVGKPMLIDGFVVSEGV